MPAKCGSLAAREGRNTAVGQALGARQPHVERPFLLLAPALLGELAFGVGRPSSPASPTGRNRDDGGGHAAAAVECRPSANIAWIGDKS